MSCSLTVELTGLERWAGLPARGSIDRERLAGKPARRGGSGVERRVRPHPLPDGRACLEHGSQLDQCVAVVLFEARLSKPCLNGAAELFLSAAALDEQGGYREVRPPSLGIDRKLATWLIERAGNADSQGRPFRVLHNEVKRAAIREGNGALDTDRKLQRRELASREVDG